MDYVSLMHLVFSHAIQFYFSLRFFLRVVAAAKNIASFHWKNGLSTLLSILFPLKVVRPVKSQPLSPKVDTEGIDAEL